MLHSSKQSSVPKLILAFLLAFSILLSACSSPTTAPEPTASPNPTTIPEPVLETMSQADLVGETWQWIGLRETMPASQSMIADSENYTLTFNEDGTVNIKADCNVAIGSYQLSGDQLTISMGPTTLAECGPESSYSQFLSLLEQAAGVGMGYGNLVITLANEAGEMFFQRATTSSLTLDLQPVNQSDLVDILWQWVSLVETMPASQSMVADSQNYNLIFRADGTYSAKADCNQLMGSYELIGNQLKLLPGISTLAECGPDSSYDLYRSLLERVTGAGTRDGVLVLVLAEDAGIMNFNNMGEAPQATETKTIEGDPALVFGPPDGTENFDNQNNWSTFDNSCFKSEISGGQFLMTAKGIPQTVCWEVTWPQLDNFYIETTLQMPATCDPQDRFGFLFRAPDNNRGYLYGFNCAGQYSLSIWDGQATIVLVEPTNSSAILTGPGQVNRMGVLAYGGQFQLYANGYFLNQAFDSTYLDPGKIGYFVRANSTQPFTVAYDNLKVWLVDENYYPPSQQPPVYPPVQPVPPGSGTVTGTSNALVGLNVRTGPSTEYPILGTVPQGTQGQILGTSPDFQWYAVKVPTSVSGNGTGWVSGAYVTLSNPSNAPLPVIIPPPPPPPAGVIPPASPNAPTATFIETAVLRMGPGSEYPVYGTVKAGAKAAIVGRNKDKTWWAISVSPSVSADGVAWVYYAYLTTQNATDVKALQAPTLPSNVTPSAPGSNAPAAITLEPVNVRSGPGNTYMSYGKVPIGTVMAVIGVSPDKEFWVVKLPTTIAKDGQGWVPVRYTSYSNTSSVPVVQPPPLP